MGDRCTIGTEHENTNLYLHWNSDLEDVTAFLDFCAMMRYRPMDEDHSYGLARLCQVVCNTMGLRNGLSVGIVEDYRENWDNGHYIVKEWYVAKRVNVQYKNLDGEVPLVPDENIVWENVQVINECQPSCIHMDGETLRTKWEEVRDYRQTKKPVSVDDEVVA